MDLFLILSLAYFLPTIVGLASHKSGSLGIFLVNLFLGWTIIGWIVAFFWALGPKPKLAYPTGSTPASSGRLCSKCGTLAPVGAHFCASCGHAV